MRWHCLLLALLLAGLIGAVADSVSLSAEPDAAADAPAQTWQWKSAKPSPFARVEAPSLAISGKLYLFGGFTSDLDASPQVDVYDPASDEWRRLNDMPTQVTHLNPALDGSTVWLAGGFKGKHPGPVTDEVWKYDVAADAWSPGPSLPAARAGGALVIEGRQLHYFGGYHADRDTGSAEHWVLSLDGGTAWQHAADLPDPRGHISGAVLGGKLYALGGAYGHDKTQIDSPSCHVFDPASGKWSAIARLPDGRSHFESSTIEHAGRIWVVGGRCNSSNPPRGVVNDVLAYDPQADRWSTLATLPQAVMAPSAALIDGRLVLSCGGLNNPRPLEAATRIAELPK